MNLKKAFILIFLLGIFITNYAQQFASDKGAIWISTSGGYSKQSGNLFEVNNNDKTSSFLLDASSNYFIAKNIFIGGTIEYLNQKDGEEQLKGIGFGPQVGYAFGNAEAKTFPYINVGLLYYKMKANIETPVYDYSSYYQYGYGSYGGYGGYSPYGYGYEYVDPKNRISDSGLEGFDLVLGFGWTIEIKKHLGLVLDCSYHIMKLKDKETDISKSGNLISVNLGIIGLLYKGE